VRGLALAIACACSGAPGAVTIDRVTPPHAPVGGGTRVVIEGSGFDHAPNRVIVGGIEAPLAYAPTDTTLEIIVPAGDRAGDAELIVINELGNATAAGMFRYSTAPALTGVSPDRVVAAALPTRITVLGHGFLDEGAGTPQLLVDGIPALDVTVTSDTELSFTAEPGLALARPVLELTNDRGTARLDRGYRVVPSDRPGLLLFPQFNQTFAIYIDPDDLASAVTIPHQSAFISRYSTIAIDEAGDLVAFDRNSSTGSGRIGRIDLRTHRMVDPVETPFWLPTMVHANGVYYAIDRQSLRFGSVDPAAGTFTRISTSPVPCCGSYGLAYDGTTMYVVARGGTRSITPIDIATGAFGTAVPLTAPPSFHVEEMRFLGGTLYAISRDGSLAKIDPATGTVTVLPITVGRALAMEVLD
jgi:hypothetical protein